MSFRYINAETKTKEKKFSSSKLKKLTSSANEFPLHECRNKKCNFSFPPSFQIRKNPQVQSTSFRYTNEETKMILLFYLKSEKKNNEKFTSQSMSFTFTRKIYFSEKMYKSI